MSAMQTYYTQDIPCDRRWWNGPRWHGPHCWAFDGRAHWYCAGTWYPTLRARIRSLWCVDMRP